MTARATTRPRITPLTPVSDAGTAVSDTPTAPATCDCHYCGGVLPRGRALTFCPYCGQNVTVRHCPACSAEVEMAWKYCVCCGRGVGD
jgi:hypothetical protein